jgi:hypothetical protein
MSPKTIDELVAACKSATKAEVVWSGGMPSSPIKLSADLIVLGDKTIDFGGIPLYNRTVRVQKGAKQVKIRNLRNRVGSLAGFWEDAFNAGDYSGSQLTEDLVIMNSEFAWAGDVNAVILGKARRVTFQHVAFYEGLFGSAHSESYGGSAGDADGHSLNLNLAGKPQADGPTKYTVIECLLGYTQSRNWRVIGVSEAELLNSLLVDCHEGPQGIPVSARVENNVFLRPGTWGFLPKGYTNEVFRHQNGGEYSASASGQVYAAGNLAEGFTLTSGAIVGTAAKFARSEATILPAQQVEDAVLARVGAWPRDAYFAQLIDDVKNRRPRKALMGKDQYPPKAL